MMPEIGLFALVLALLVAVVQAVLPLVGAHCGVAPWMRVARPAALLQCALCLLAFGVLAACFLRGDFSVLYVAANSHSTLPAIYRFTAVWGGHEGSMLLWQTLLSVWGAAVALLSGRLPRDYVARVLAVLGALSIGMLVFLLWLSNPFARLSPAAPEGRDLDLRDPPLDLAVHDAIAHPRILQPRRHVRAMLRLGRVDELLSALEGVRLTLDLIGPPTFGMLRLLVHWATRDRSLEVDEDELLAKLRATGANDWEQAVADAERELVDRAKPKPPDPH